MSKMLSTWMRFNFEMRRRWRWLGNLQMYNYKCKSWCWFINCAVTFNAGTICLSPHTNAVSSVAQLCTVHRMKVVIFHAIPSHLVSPKMEWCLDCVRIAIFCIQIPVLSSLLLSACVQYWEGKKAPARS